VEEMHIYQEDLLLKVDAMHGMHTQAILLLLIDLPSLIDLEHDQSMTTVYVIASSRWVCSFSTMRLNLVTAMLL